MNRLLVNALALASVTWPAGAQNDAPALTIETLESRPGIVERFADLVPNGNQVASLILLVGGEGRLNLKAGSTQIKSGNFLVRTSMLFAEAGFRVAVLDTPSDHPELRDFRVTDAHAHDIAAVIRLMRARSPVPVWLVGTSRGTISAVDAAARLSASPDAPNGIVLTSAITTRGRRDNTSVYDVPLAQIRVPVLVVGHRNDGCEFSSYVGAQGLVRTLASSAPAELLGFTGGNRPKSGPCEPFAPHGYFGIEEQVVAAITSWIKSHQ